MGGVDVENLRRGYEAATRGDWDAVEATWDPDIEWIPAPQYPIDGPVRGAERVRSFLEDQQATIGAIETRVERVFERGDHIAVFVRNTVRSQRSNSEFEIRVAHLWTMRDGRAIRCQVFPRREDALAAAGISDS